MHTYHIQLKFFSCDENFYDLFSALSNTGWGKRRFTVIHMENNIIINNNKNKLSRTHTINLLLPHPVYSTVLLTIVTMLYIASPWLNYFITESLYLLTVFTHFAQSPHPGPLPTLLWQLFSIICSLLFMSLVFVFLDFIYKWDHTVLVVLCLTYFM